MSGPSGHLDQLREIGGDEFVREVVEEFMEVASGHMATLRSSLRDDDAETFHRAIHMLGTLALTIDLKEMGSVCRSLEARSMDGIPEGAGRELARIRGLFERAHQQYAA